MTIAPSIPRNKGEKKKKKWIVVKYAEVDLIVFDRETAHLWNDDSAVVMHRM